MSSLLVGSSAGRAALWRLLSLGFAPPSAETLTEVEALAEGVLGIDGPAEVADLLAALRASSHDDLRAEYQSLFGGTVAVAPYEGSYEVDPLRQGRQMADIAGFYRAFGAEAHGPASERPDHLGCELEFLSFLELKKLLESEAGEVSEAELVDEIEEAFLRDHAGRWLPTFFAEVRGTADADSVFAALAAVGARVVADELERRALEPASLPRRHPELSVERDSFDCGASTQSRRGG
jgi:putative dimethyl sulfoxide reductase chaperone